MIKAPIQIIEKQENLMILKKPKTMIWTSLLLGIIFDYLFNKKIPGISFFIFVMAVLLAGFYLAKLENIKASKNTLYLLIPIFFFSIMSFMRTEPLTTFLNHLITFVLLGIFSHSYLGGKWPFYGLFNYFSAAFSLGIDAISRQFIIFSKSNKSEQHEDKQIPKRKIFWSYLRGLALSIPILMFFSNLLSSADPVFAKALDDIFKVFNLEFLGEYIFRGISILFMSYMLAGVFLHSFYKDHDDQQLKINIPKLLGFTETSIILGSVNILFLSFVVFQFQYFFGGQDNVALNGFTYAEYAQKGFAELVAVAVFSLILFLGLSNISKKENQKQRNMFSGLGITLFLLIGVILVSALQRMHLYEQAYGFTRLRTYTHVFIIWLAILLAVVVLFEIFKLQKFFTFAALIASMGFIVSLNILNVDAFIAYKNIERLTQFDRLDISYLSSLSDDVIPALTKLYTDSSENKEEIAGVISCHALRNQYYDVEKQFYNPYGWQSFNYSRYKSQKIWSERQENGSDVNFIDNLTESDNQYDKMVLVNDVEVWCWEYWD